MIEFLYNAFVAPLTQTYFQKALLGGGVVAIVCGVVGCLVVLRRMAFLGDALSHAMIAGVAGGYLFMKLLFGIEAHAPAMLIGSVIAAVLTVGLIGQVARFSRIKEDAAIGIMYTGIFAAGVVLVSIFRNYIHIDLMHFIMGDVLGIADVDLWVSVIVAAVVLSIMVLFFRYFQITSFDPVMAASLGLPVIFIDYVLTTCVSLVVVSAVSMVGVILVVGLLITPAATAYLLSDRLDRMMILAGFFGLSSVVGGLYLSNWIDSAGGGAIMVFCTLQFLLVLLIAPRYGILADWRRRRRMVPQQTLEDILKFILRNESVTPDQLGRDDQIKAALVPKTIRHLSDENLVSVADNRISLTESGRREALKIQRAHRLWESYLEHVGTPAEKIHPTAEKLEHLQDDTSVEYISHLLGHPEKDPHGSLIPAHGDTLTADQTFALSLLRTGDSARVEAVDAEVLAETDLNPGDTVKLLNRTDDGDQWTLRLPPGHTITLNHHQADLITVKPVPEPATQNP